jgi:arylsulfatase A-like enzyme
MFLWVHYVEPHAPYRLWKEHTEPLGIRLDGNVQARDRYDTEIACIDRIVGDLLEELTGDELLRDPLIVFAADHGESLGEHNYWGHGRHLYEATLHIPMSITWPGHLDAGTVGAPALITDLAPTVMRLLGLEPPRDFQGFDWSGVLLRGENPPEGRITTYQAHKGAVISNHKSELARRSGLLEIGMIDGSLKEIYHVEKKRRRVFHLGEDPDEKWNLSTLKTQPSEALLSWLSFIADGLVAADEVPAEPLDPESAERLRALGYVE